MNSKIIFLKANNNQEKLLAITTTVQKHFDQAQNLLIYCSNEEAANYLDSLLWKMPEESFLPHKIADQPCHDKVVITCQPQNINQATVLINLSTTLHPHFNTYQVVYDLYDETHPVKLELSKARQSSYHKEGYEFKCYD